MRVRSVRHRGLKRLIEDDDERGIRLDLTSRVRRILTALLSAEDIGGLQGPPGLADSSACRRPGRDLEHIGLRQLADYLQHRE